MLITERLAGTGPHFSFEFFPPNTPKGEQNLFAAVEGLKQVNPSFISVTCGAGGGTRRQTTSLAARIQDDLGVESVAHLTCRGLTRKELEASIAEIREAGLKNILALRGDAPMDGSQVTGCEYASDLVALIRAIYPEACIGAACYPEGHTDASDKMADMDNLKRKVDAGVDFLITQIFFDNRHYFEFLGRASSRGIRLPILPGIMPIQNTDQVKTFTGKIGASLPKSLLDLLEMYKASQKAVFHIGIAHAIAQSHELLASGVPGIHFITLNKSPATRIVVEALG